LHLVRYEKGHKATTRRRIVGIAARRFRKGGIDAVGVADLMAGLGLTHGGFYAHFRSKEELLREALAVALAETQAKWVHPAKKGKGGFEALVRAYLDEAHVTSPDRGCVCAALAPEIARRPRRTRDVFEKGLMKSIDALAAQLGGDKDPVARRRRAFAVIGVMMGTLQLARAVADEKLARQILRSGIEAALTLGKKRKA
jgi:TetR/AcrR family transcriptional repressor of nem operon